MKVFRRLILPLSAVALFSCAQPPEEKMADVRRELAAVEMLDAETWAPHPLESAREAIATAEAEIVKQDDRFAWNREYDKAGAILALAMEDLERARDSSIDAKLEAEELARESLEAAAHAVSQARAALLIVPVSRRGAVSARHLDSVLTRIARELDDVRRLILEEEFSEALVRSEEILKKTSNLLATLSRAS